MNQGDPLLNVLFVLLDKGSVPLSSLRPGVHEELAGQLDAGVLVVKRIGAGRRVEVCDNEALVDFTKRRFPAAFSGSREKRALVHSDAVAQWRDAKRARSAGAEPVLMRAFGETRLLRGEAELAAAELTRLCGVSSVVINGDIRGRETAADNSNRPSWSMADGITYGVAVVENLELFLSVEVLRLPIDIAIYAGGRMSQLLLDWLASPTFSLYQFFHCGDYDPVGLDEYVRLQRVCPGRVILYCPPKLERLIRDYGNEKLLERSSTVLQRLRGVDDAAVRRVVAWLDEYGRGLEQEVLLVFPPGEYKK